MKIDFEYQTPHGIYRDALHLDDNHSFTQEQINEMQLERINYWITSVETNSKIESAMDVDNG